MEKSNEKDSSIGRAWSDKAGSGKMASQTLGRRGKCLAFFLDGVSSGQLSFEIFWERESQKGGGGGGENWLKE